MGTRERKMRKMCLGVYSTTACLLVLRLLLETAAHLRYRTNVPVFQYTSIRPIYIMGNKKIG